jgi:hypothetical protein
MLNKEFVALVKQDLNSLNFDDYIPDEYIWSKGITTLEFLIKRETDSRKIYNNSKLFETMYIEMEEIDSVFCGIKLPCKKVCKSKEKIKKTFSTSSGSLLIVSNILNESVYKEVLPTRYSSVSNRGVISKTKYWWIENDYLIIPSEICFPQINIQGLFITTNVSNCESMLDQVFPCPDYLLTACIDTVVSKILETKKRIPIDENANLNTNSK